jgi:IS605 OrfB family transposase
VEFQLSEWHRQYSSWKIISFVLTYKKHKHEMYLGVVVESETPAENHDGAVLGIDRGLRKLAVSSNGHFFNSRKMNEVRGRYAHLRRELQARGTRSAKRRLRNISGRERRFIACQNHRIAKEIVNSPNNIIALEDLKQLRENKKCMGKLNEWIHRWPFYQLETFIRYKAEALGKTVVNVNPANTSIRCSRCGHTERGNRKGNQFHCLRCGFSLDPDLNAARNIAERGKASLSRLLVDQPDASRDEDRAHELWVGSIGAQMQVPSEMKHLEEFGAPNSTPIGTVDTCRFDKGTVADIAVMPDMMEVSSSEMK